MARDTVVPASLTECVPRSNRVANWEKEFNRWLDGKLPPLHSPDCDLLFKLDEPVDYLDKGFSLMLLPPSKELKESIRFDDMTIDLK